MGPIRSVFDFYRSRSPLQVAALTPYFLLVTCLGTAGIIAFERNRHPLPSGIPVALTLSWWGLAGTILYLLLMNTRWGQRLTFGPIFSTDAFKAYVVSFQVGLVLLLLPTRWAYQHTWYHRLTWYLYEYQDKRWLYGLYWVAVFTCVVGPSLFHRFFCSPGNTASQDSPSLAGPESADLARASNSDRPTFIVRVSRIALAVAVALFFAGPPWNLAGSHQDIDYHEQVHLGPLQAFARGSLSYIGPASVQYGPGSQFMACAYMTLTDQFDMIGYRESLALCHFLTFLIFCLVVFLTIDIRLGPLTVPLAMAFSPLSLYTFGNGVLWGYFGWGNGMRYAGVLLLVATLPALARYLSRAKWGVSPSAVGIGFLWGVFCWIAQENFSGGLTAGTLLLVLLWSTRTLVAREVFLLLMNLAIGFLLFWAPLLGFYAWHGCCGEFVSNYFLIPKMVMQGWCNTPWSDNGTESKHTYHLAWLFFFAVGVLTLCDLRRCKLRGPLTRNQVTLLSFLCVSLACYTTSFFRSDAPHLTVTMLATPVVVVLAITFLPAFQASSWSNRWLLRGLIVAAAIYVFPVMFPPAGILWPRKLIVGETIVAVLALIDTPSIVALRWSIRWPLQGLVVAATALLAVHVGWLERNQVQSWATTYLSRYQHPHAEPVDDHSDVGIAFHRAGLLTHEPLLSYGSVPMRDGLRLMSELHELVQDRKAYVFFLNGIGSPGLVYFLADLRPAPVSQDLATMVINSDLRETFLKHFATHAAEIECVITTTLDIPEFQLFRQIHPDALLLERTTNGKRVYVALTRDD